MSNWLREHNRQIVAVCMIVTMLLTALNSVAIAEQRDRLTREIDLLWAGVDIVLSSQPVNSAGVTVKVESFTRQGMFTDKTGKVWEPKDVKVDEFLIIYLSLAEGTSKQDLAVWFEDGGTHGARVLDEKGNRSDFVYAYFEEPNGDENLVVAFVFVVKKNATQLMLRLPDGSTVDLALVPTG